MLRRFSACSDNCLGSSSKVPGSLLALFHLSWLLSHERTGRLPDELGHTVVSAFCPDRTAA